MLDHGIDLALGNALRPVLYVEREAVAAANLAWQMEAGFLAPAPVWSDIETATRPHVRRYIRTALSRGKPDLLIGGIPCQPWSLIGPRRGSTDSRDLWPAVVEIVGVYEPGIVFFENVPGILSQKAGAFRIFRELQAMGYTTTAGLFSSKEMGATHERQRLFILGMRGGGRVDLANSIAAGWQADGRENTRRQARAGSGIRRPIMADTGKRGRGRRSVNPSWHNLERKGSERKKMDDWPYNTGANLANTARKRRVKGPRSEQSPAGIAGRLAAPVRGKAVPELWRYAPRPDDFGLWATVAEVEPSRMPALESEFFRMGHGMASRADRLSIIGNGVDPLVAGFAFVSLFSGLTS